MWADFTQLADDNSAVSCIEYDKTFDLLWFAHSNGRLSSYSLVDSGTFLEDKNLDLPPSIHKYSSFPASIDTISGIIPNFDSIVTVGYGQIGVFSHGGLTLSSIKFFDCPSFCGELLISGGFTCGDIIRDPNVPRSTNTYLSNTIVAGTSTENTYLFDLNNTFGSRPIAIYNVSCPSVKIENNGHMTVVAGKDGNIRFLDGKFRSMEVINTIEAHSGSIRDMSMQFDGRTLITCGTSRRAINPYDLNSPFHVSVLIF